ncbi:glutamate racemase [Thiohalocapsa marina]|uniref:Glutamate racemase n=1 Tax=Thiohalocapsa marina TaxID=424902 RepID=A0A5M8FPX2_9GAMM|nr:glutamate racemase [Thiohalocapsa marina]KAA6186953.1 glutamate racemase [Thiohalocapsa marina]
MTARLGPIGVFDSGVGGLTVLREIRRELPAEDLLYIADSGHAPYGDKPAHQVEARAIAIGERLRNEGAKAVVVACNTATAIAAQSLRARLDIPVIAMEPAIKPAAEQTRSGVVGVLATSGTLVSDRFLQLVGRFRERVEVLVRPCPGLVEQVEAGQLDSDATRALLADYVLPLLARGADTLVLGCTHYPHLAPLIRELAGPDVIITDSGAAVARQVRRRLTETGLLNPRQDPGAERIWTSAAPAAQTVQLIRQLWHASVRVDCFPHNSPADAGVTPGTPPERANDTPNHRTEDQPPWP